MREERERRQGTREGERKEGLEKGEREKERRREGQDDRRSNERLIFLTLTSQEGRRRKPDISLWLRKDRSITT